LPAPSHRVCRDSAAQDGATLIFTLIILIAISLVGISAAHIALLGEKSSRNDRDRKIAFQAAEATLLDAEREINQSSDQNGSRSALFASHKTAGFMGGCGSGDDNPYLGLCRHGGDGAIEPWLAVDFLDEAAASAQTVPYGKFTGQVFETGKGMSPSRTPRYIIELLPFATAGENAEIEGRSYFYRITAVGFGAKDGTRVMLQTVYHKE
jgi:type IV pilus assembly protein PilX